MYQRTATTRPTSTCFCCNQTEEGTLFGGSPDGRLAPLPRGSLWGVFDFGFACRKAVTLSGRTSITPLGEGGGGAVDYEWVRHRLTATAAFKPPLRLPRSASRVSTPSLAAPKLSPSLLALSLSLPSFI